MGRKIFGFQIDPKKIEDLNRYVIPKNFNSIVNEIANINLSINKSPHYENIVFDDESTSGDSTVKVIDTLRKIKLDPKKGEAFSKKVIHTGYDESKLQFDALEGIVNVVSHSLLTISQKEFFPISLISIYFYTRSKHIFDNTKYVRYSESPDEDSKIDYAVDRNQLIIDSILENSILFIDGPLIGGNLSAYSIKLVNSLHEKNVVPIFFVKNSQSNLVTNSILELVGKYNSDLHWSYNYLKAGERTNLFLYTDNVNQNNSKIFCYIKPFNNVSPQRIEIHPQTFRLYGEYINDILNFIYYLLIVQGDTSNPQIRPIALSEKYAREIIKTVNIRSILKNTSLTASINQERFGG
jgi:hypothetical protein